MNAKATDEEEQQHRLRPEAKRLDRDPLREKADPLSSVNNERAVAAPQELVGVVQDDIQRGQTTQCVEHIQIELAPRAAQGARYDRSADRQIRGHRQETLGTCAEKS